MGAEMATPKGTTFRTHTEIVMTFRADAPPDLMGATRVLAMFQKEYDQLALKVEEANGSAMVQHVTKKIAVDPPPSAATTTAPTPESEAEVNAAVAAALSDQPGDPGPTEDPDATPAPVEEPEAPEQPADPEAEPTSPAAPEPQQASQRDRRGRHQHQVAAQ